MKFHHFWALLEKSFWLILEKFTIAPPETNPSDTHVLATGAVMRFVGSISRV